MDILKFKARKNMGYSYIEGRNYLGHGPNISGANYLCDAINKANAGKVVYPALEELIKTGEADAAEVKREAERLAKRVRAKNVKGMLGLLACAAAQAKKVITIS